MKVSRALGLRLQASIVVLLDRDPGWADGKLRFCSERDPQVEPSPRLPGFCTPRFAGSLFL